MKIKIPNEKIVRAIKSISVNLSPIAVACGIVVGIYSGIKTIEDHPERLPYTSDLKNFSKEEINSLKPDFRVRLLRYIENNDMDSLNYLRKNIIDFEKDKKLVDKIQKDIQTIQNLIQNKDFRIALNAIITLKGDISKIKMFNTDFLKQQTDSLRVALYKEAQRE